MSQKELAEKLYNQVLHFLSFRPRSEKEIRDYLSKQLRKFYNKRLARASDLSQNQVQNEVKKIIRELKKQNLVNDKEFVDWWIEQRLAFSPKGRRVLRLELLQKGIGQELMEEKLGSVSQVQLAKGARKILTKKIRLYRGVDKKVLKSRLLKHLLTRGFEYDLSKKLVDDFLQKR